LEYNSHSSGSEGEEMEQAFKNMKLEGFECDEVLKTEPH